MALVEAEPSLDAIRERDRMSSRERLEAALLQRPVDRVPVSFKTIDPYKSGNPRLARDPNYARVTELARRYTDVMHVWKFDDREPFFSGSDDFRVQTETTPAGETRTTVTTSHGQLTKIARVVESSTWTIKHFIETEDDLDIFLRHQAEPLRPDLHEFWDEREKLGDMGMMKIPLSDPIGMVAPLLPRETLYIWMMEQPSLVDLLHQRMFEQLRDTVEYLAKSGVRCTVQFSGAEYAAPPMASPELFDRYVGKYGRPITDVLWAHACTPTLHCHSRVAVLLSRFADMGYAATHPVEPPPMGDVTAARFKHAVGGRLTMIGNVQIGEVLAGEAADIFAWVRDLIAVMGTRTGLIVSESATPWETPMRDCTVANYRAMIEAAYRSAGF